jgi:demethylmenaquinone methyltransferase/2-methoxy-6-polyprenyl-1,4-benzoquinol methylase
VQNPEFVHQAFSKIAPRYVVTNHVLSLGVDVFWRRRVARMIAALTPQPATMLDLATGSGDLALEIGKALPQLQMTGVDFCEPMLDLARQRKIPHLALQVADALDLPFADASYDVVTAGFGLRNMASWPEALCSMSRVLRPGGHLVILDFSLPGNALVRCLYRFYLHRIMPLIGGIVGKERQAYAYLAESIEKFPSGAAMERLICDNGFQTCSTTPVSFGVASIYLARKSD